MSKSLQTKEEFLMKKALKLGITLAAVFTFFAGSMSFAGTCDGTQKKDQIKDRKGRSNTEMVILDVSR